MSTSLEEMINALRQSVEQDMTKAASDASTQEAVEVKTETQEPAIEKVAEAQPIVDEKTKSAAELGAEMARSIMEKAASMKSSSAQAVGKTLAQTLLEKMASAGDMTTDAGVSPGAVPSKVQADAAQQEAEQASTVKPMPGAGGNVNEIFDAMIQDALAQGAASVDQVHDTGVAAKEGAVEDHAVPAQVKTAAVGDLMEQGLDFDTAVELVKQASAEVEEDFEKMAAVNHLMEHDGLDFETASDLVKQAAEELAFEEANMTKAAALSELLQSGVDFDQAVEMIKQASAGDMTTEAGVAPGAVPSKVQADAAAQEAEQASTIKPMPGIGGNVNEIFDAMVQDALSQGAASVDQVHDTGVAAKEGAVEDHAVPSQVKTAAVAQLMEAGVDFDSAVTFVKEASAKAAIEAAKGAAKAFSGKVKGLASDAAENVKAIKNPGKWSNAPASEVRKSAVSKLAKNRLVQAGAAGAVGAAAGGYAMSKKAALEGLMERGVSFEDAVQVIAANAEKLA